MPEWLRWLMPRHDKEAAEKVATLHDAAVDAKQVQVEISYRVRLLQIKVEKVGKP